MKVNKLKNPWEASNQGTTVELEGVDGHVVVIQVREDAFFTIIHESVHIWQMMMDYMQEDNPGKEMEAYTIEHIVKTLMLHYQKVTGESLAIHEERKTRLQARSGALHKQA